MVRRKQSPFEDLIEITSKLPWWVGVALAVAAYVWLHGVATSEVAAVAQAGQLGQLVTQNIFKSLAAVGQYVPPLAFLVGAGLAAARVTS